MGPAPLRSSEGRLGLIGMTGPITRQGVVYQKMRDLTCASVERSTHWVRAWKRGSDIFGDDQFLFVVARFHGGHRAQYRRRKRGRAATSPQRGERWITSEQASDLSLRPPALLLRSFDAWPQRDLWSREFDDGEGVLAATILDPTGNSRCSSSPIGPGAGGYSAGT